DLVRYGCEVTVFEALHVAGGVLRYGIPSFRLPRDIIDREVKRLTDLGVRIETNKVIGKTFTVPQLLSEKSFDAAFVGVGAGSPAFLGIPCEFAGQVYSANEFLTRVNLMGVDQVLLRGEAEAPARIEELRHAKEEGIEFFFLHTPLEIRVDAEEKVSGIKVEEMQLGDPDEKGRRKPIPTGRFKELACDTVIYALGTKANPVVARSTPGLVLDKRGNIVADEGGAQ